MSGLLSWVLQRRMMVGIGGLIVIIMGTLSWSRLAIDAFPDVTNQQVMILTEAQGLGPLDVEQQITFPIEWVMGGLPDVKMVRSMSKTGLSQVVVIFEDDVDTYFARQLVFERSTSDFMRKEPSATTVSPPVRPAVISVHSATVWPHSTGRRT